jgi:hypothetical protein
VAGPDPPSRHADVLGVEEATDSATHRRHAQQRQVAGPWDDDSASVGEQRQQSLGVARGCQTVTAALRQQDRSASRSSRATRCGRCPTGELSRTARRTLSG